MPRELNFYRELGAILQDMRQSWRTITFTLGGTSGSGGGSGAAPGGFSGQLAQQFVCGDTDELRVLTSGSVSSLLDNLNRIRYWEQTQIAASAPSPTFAGQLWVDTSSGSLLKVRDNADSSWMTVSSSGSGGGGGVTGLYTGTNSAQTGIIDLVAGSNVTITQSSGSLTWAVDLSGYVPTSRTVNGHALTSNVTVTASDVGLGSVENTALSTWAGTTNITTLGTIATGTWHGGVIDPTYGGTGVNNGSNQLTIPATGTAVLTSRTISTTAPLTGGGDLSTNRTFAISQAGVANDGFLSSADWNSFNNKVSGLTPFTTVAPLDIAGTAVIGSSGSVPHADHVHRGVTGLYVAPNTDLFGSIALVGTSNITVTQSSGSFTFGTSGSFVPVVHDINGGYHTNFPLTPANGGTGVNNGTRTITINTNNAAFTFSGAYTLTVAGNASVSGTNTGDQNLSGYVPTTRTITEGAGLAGNTYDLTDNRTLALGTPDSLGVNTTNSVPVGTHTHAILWSANPGAASSILGTDASGNLTIAGTLKASGTTDSTSTITGALQVSGGAGIAKTLSVGTTLGVGIAPAAHVAVYAFPTLASVGATAYGFVGGVTVNNATTNAYGVLAVVGTTATAITMTNAKTIYAQNPSKGAGSTITNAYGLYIENITAGGTLNYAIYSGGGKTRLDNNATANGSVATVLGSVGPTGSHTTVQKWLTIDFDGTVGYIPVF